MQHNIALECSRFLEMTLIDLVLYYNITCLYYLFIVFDQSVRLSIGVV